MFSLFYVARKKRETALLSGFGVSKAQSFRWVFTQSAAVVIIAQGAVLTVVSFFFKRILNAAISISASFTAGYRNFALSEMEITGGLQIELPLDATLTGVLAAAAGMALLLLIVSGILSARAALSNSLMRREGD